MRINEKFKGFGLEIRLGLILIVLLLVILDIASYYTLYRIGETVETQIREELTEAAVISSNSMSRVGKITLPAGLEKNIKEKYDLLNLKIVPLDYDRIIAIRKNSPLDAELLEADSTLKAGELVDLLLNRPVYRHKSGSDEYQLIFPTEYLGSSYMIIISKPSSILGPIENAMRILLFFGFLTGIIIVFISIRLIHMVLYPFNRLKEEAKKTGHFVKGSADDVELLVKSYEEIINDLKSKEIRLVELNEIIMQKAATLEVYNDYVLRSISAGIITLDTNHNISTINPAAEKLLKFDADTIIGINCSLLVENFSELGQLICHYFEDEQPIINHEISIISEGDKKFIMSASISPLVDSAGGKIGCALILNDQTEFVRLQEELELNRRMATLGEMSAGLAHQLRNSTAAIVGFAKIIEKRINNETARKNIDYLTGEAMQAEKLIARFLDYARPLRPVNEEIDFCALIDEIILSIKQLYPSIVIKLVAKNTKKIIIDGDYLLMKQALTNIIDNGCKSYETMAGKIIVEYSENIQNHIIEICDNGSGISEEYRDNIFTPFFSGTPSGSGLGLPLAQKIISLHNGQINFKNNPDGGSIFTIILPAATKKNSAVSSALSSAE